MPSRGLSTRTRQDWVRSKTERANRYSTRSLLTLARSASEVAKNSRLPPPRLRFGLVWIVSFYTAWSISIRGIEVEEFSSGEGRDSNPRSLNRLADQWGQCNKPLCHLSEFSSIKFQAEREGIRTLEVLTDLPTNGASAINRSATSPMPNYDTSFSRVRQNFPESFPRRFSASGSKAMGIARIIRVPSL